MFILLRTKSIRARDLRGELPLLPLRNPIGKDLRQAAEFIRSRILCMTNFSINTADAKEEFSELINRVSHHKERIILTRRGKEVAAIIPIEDLQLILQIQNKSDLEAATESLKEARDHGTITLDDLKDEIG